jgi:hypothetical protein
MIHGLIFTQILTVLKLVFEWHRPDFCSRTARRSLLEKDRFRILLAHPSQLERAFPQRAAALQQACRACGKGFAAGLQGLRQRSI